MRSVGGDWESLPNRGPPNIHEHVNFYAKASLGSTCISSDPLESPYEKSAWRRYNLTAHYAFTLTFTIV